MFRHECKDVCFCVRHSFCPEPSVSLFSPVEWDLLQNAIAAQREQTVLLQLGKTKKNKAISAK